MKKIISILIAIALVPSMLFAQEGAAQEQQYLPEAGEFAIGVDVLPVLSFLGNTFNGTMNNSISNLSGTPALNANNANALLPSVSIMGKYMFTDNWALKANLGLMLRNQNTRQYIIDQHAQVLNPLSQDKVIDTESYTRNGFSLALQAEYRKGTRKIQGIFGAGVLFAMTNEKYDYQWGNQMTTINQMPNTSFSNVYDGSYRLLSQDNGNTFYVGIIGSVGFEWFVAPKISLGAEVSLSLFYTAGTQTYTTREGYNRATEQIEIRTDIDTPGNTGITFGTDNLGGSLFMMFYF